MNTRSILARLGAVTSATGLVVLGVAGAASAHVTVTPSTTAAGGDSLLTLAVPHGCNGSATTKITISMPKEIIEATPTRNPFYAVSKKDVKLTKPITAEDGDQITEKVDTVTYTARTPLPDGYRDAFEIQIQVPDQVGKRLTFPTIQQCQKGQTAWTEVPAPGQDPESLEHPAPGFVITAADTTSAASASTADTKASTSATGGSGNVSSSDSSRDGWGYAGVAVGAVGVALGAAALARSRREA
jgi:periplasmic copper chaperone A